MIGDRVKQFRETRGWTQSHLAEASGVGERTIQRVEARHSYSGETAMALASALGVQVRDLTASDAAGIGEHRPLWAAPSPKTAGWIAILLTIPGALLIFANTLREAGVTDVPMAALETPAKAIGLVPTFWYFWPVPLLAAPLVGIVLTLASLVRIHGRVEGTAITLTGIELRWHPLAAAALLLCAATMFAPAANLIGDLVVRAAHASLD